MSALAIVTMIFVLSVVWGGLILCLKKAINVGAIFAIVLVAVLLHVEVTEPFHNNTLNILGRIRRRFSKLSAILFIIFITMMFSNVIMILG